MRKYIPILCVSLFFCLFIYVFYRTEKTLINQIFITIFSQESHSFLRKNISSFIPLPDFFVYSLPEGLWVFCITITSSFFYVEVQKRKWNLVFAPLLVALIMELFQLIQLSRGRFDWIDIGFATAFWVLAIISTRTNCSKEPVFKSVNPKTICFLLSYSIVYLAHVSY